MRNVPDLCVYAEWLALWVIVYDWCTMQWTDVFGVSEYDTVAFVYLLRLYAE